MSAVAPPASVTGGNLGLQSNTAPPTHSLDFSVFKDFAFTESGGFSSESFNLTNTPQFGTPQNNRQNADFGRISGTQAGSERHVQFAVRLRF